MASKTFMLFTIAILGATVVAPVAQGQLLGLGTLNIAGIVNCSTGTTGTVSALPFANAGVQLKCGNNVVSSTTTNSNGQFNMSLNFITTILSTLLSSCKLQVTTPLSTCDASLPTSGILQSALQLLNGGGGGSIVGGLLGIVTNIIPTGFNLIPALG